MLDTPILSTAPMLTFDDTINTVEDTVETQPESQKPSQPQDVPHLQRETEPIETEDQPTMDDGDQKSKPVFKEMEKSQEGNWDPEIIGPRLEVSNEPEEAAGSNPPLQGTGSQQELASTSAQDDTSQQELVCAPNSPPTDIESELVCVSNSPLSDYIMASPDEESGYSSDHDEYANPYETFASDRSTTHSQHGDDF